MNKSGWIVGMGIFAAATSCSSEDGVGTRADALDQAADVYLNAMPPGSNGNSAGGLRGIPPLPTIYPPNFTDALALYGDLAYAKQGLKSGPCNPPKNASEHAAASDLACNYFKHEGLDPDVVKSTETLRTPEGKSVTVRRDGWGVPFIDAPDRQSAMYAFGYASAQDRLWLHDVLRHIGRGRLSEYLGPARFFYDFDADFATLAGYSEEELTAMVESTRRKNGVLGELIVNDLDGMVNGINAYIDSLGGRNILKIPPEYTFLKPFGYPPARWTRNDIVASATLIQSLFAGGGGGEHLNELLLQHLDGSLKPGSAQIATGACEFWRDVRHADDPDQSRTIATSFATQSPARVSESCPAALPAGAAIWEPGSFKTRRIFQTQLGIVIGNAKQEQRKAAPPPRGIDAPLDPVEGTKEALRRAGFPLPSTMSNFIGVTANQTAAGHPIAVMGPQSAYFLPQLLWEVSIRSHGGTPQDFEGRGVVFGDLPYINIGRGVDFAWSATSGGSDLTDIRVSKLCNVSGSAPSRDDANQDGYPDADGYSFDAGDGRGPICRPFYKRTDRWNVIPTPASIATNDGSVPQLPHVATRYVLRTHYGPVFATAIVGGAPVAVSIQRSTFFGELETAAPYALVGTRTVKDAASFQRLFNSNTGSFNWLYVDKKDLGYFHSGLYPTRAAGHHPELPVWGDGRFEWGNMRQLPADYFSSFGGSKIFVTNTSTPVAQGDPLNGYFEWKDFLPFSAHPRAINPAKGTIASWNNSPAKDWWAADANGAYGTTHRVDMLQKRLDAFQLSGKKHDIASMIEVMADAAYTDLRGQEVLPLLLQLLRTGPLTADEQTVVDSMQTWLDEGSNRWISGGAGLGAYRRDRNQDSKYDFRAQVVLMDAWYPRLTEKLLPELDALARAGVPVLQGRDDAPGGRGSAYQQGWFQHMKRVLQMALGTPGHRDYRQLKCASDGSATSCRNAVLESLSLALADLGGLANRANWDGSTLPNGKGRAGAVVEDYDSVEHTAMSFLTVKPIHWTNRPTFQQVVQIFSSR